MRVFKSILSGCPSFTIPGPIFKGLHGFLQQSGHAQPHPKDRTRSRGDPRATLRGQQSFTQSPPALHPALFKQHFFDYVAVQILVFANLHIRPFHILICAPSLTPLRPPPAGFLASYLLKPTLFFSPICSTDWQICFYCVAISPSWICTLNKLGTVSRQSD